MANINKNKALSSLDEALDHLNSFPSDNVYTIIDQARYSYGKFKSNSEGV